MHTNLQLALWSFAGFLIGAAVTVPALFWYLRTDAGNQLLRAYIVPPPTWPSVIAPDTSTAVPPPLTSASTTVTVPKAYATQEYSTAVNSVVTSFNELNASYGQLLPLLLTINNKSLTHDYTNFFDLIAQSKLLIAQEKTLTIQFSQAISALASANQVTTDATTKSQTLTLVSQGGALASASQAFLSTMDQVLSGSVPSAEQIATLNTQAQGFGAAVTQFSTTAREIFVRFGQVSTTTTP